jgi:hypothetical protein
MAPACALGPWKNSLSTSLGRLKVKLLYRMRYSKNFKKIKKIPSMLEVAYGRKIASNDYFFLLVANRQPL